MKTIMMHITLVTLSLLFLISIPAHTATERRTALVIGNGSYSTGSLRNPVNDADDMAATLKRLSFDVILKKNAPQQDMEDAIRDLGDRLKKGGVGLFFYAGHGVQIAGKNYLLPIGNRIYRETDVKYRAVDTDMILDEMGNAGNAMNIVILDACRDNPFGRTFRTSSRGLAIISSAPRGTLISYSTNPGNVAADGSGRNSPYTASLVKHMTTPGLQIEDVFKNVRQDLGKQTGWKQIPWEMSSLEGNFYFNDQAGAGRDITAERKKVDEERQRIVQERELLENQRVLDEERAKLEALKREQATSPRPVVEKKEMAMGPRPHRLLIEGSGYRDPRTGMEFIAVPGGCFEVTDEEKSAHIVCVDDFYMGKYEVTQAQWSGLMGNNPSAFKNCGNKCPVEQLSWNDTQEFIAKMNQQTGKNYRLPTEAEWEYAARSGGKGEKWAGTNNSVDLRRYAWYKANSGDRTHPVGEKEPNSLGIYDMTGNVWEWCQDWYGENVMNSTRVSSSGQLRLLRGGSWKNEDTLIQVTKRLKSLAEYTGYIDGAYGFRLVVSAP